ncbi:hypothetical protein EV426DRAFT_703077 [Tirmania nivea]|nr:hypothetical protein EV426DRAFT_703077 [Tirmania nivea]
MAPKGSSSRGGGDEAGGQYPDSKTKRIAFALGIFLGPIALYIVYSGTRRVVHIYRVYREHRRSKEQQNTMELGITDSSPVPTPAAPQPTLNREAVLNYITHPRPSQDLNRGVWTAENQVYDPKTNPYLAERRDSSGGNHLS